jgi:hypothetical protein
MSAPAVGPPRSNGPPSQQPPTVQRATSSSAANPLPVSSSRMAASIAHRRRCSVPLLEHHAQTTSHPQAAATAVVALGQGGQGQGQAALAQADALIDRLQAEFEAGVPPQSPVAYLREFNLTKGQSGLSARSTACCPRISLSRRRLWQARSHQVLWYALSLADCLLLPLPQLAFVS